VRINLSEKTVKAVYARLKASLYFQELKLEKNPEMYPPNPWRKEHMARELSEIQEFFDKTEGKSHNS
jgi:hypothetical protein